MSSSSSSSSAAAGSSSTSSSTSSTSPHSVFVVEPFACSSHAQLLRWLPGILPAENSKLTIVSLPGKKWHWRLRTGSSWAATALPPLLPSSPHGTAAASSTCTLLVSSMCNLSELLALRPDLHAARKVVYMHENQLVYPPQQHRHEEPHKPKPKQAQQEDVGKRSREEEGKEEAKGGSDAPASSSSSSSFSAPLIEPEGGSPPFLQQYDRDFQFGWAQLLSLLCADIVAWNSHFNRESFLAALPRFLRMIPDKAQRPDAASVAARIRDRSVVLHLPVPVADEILLSAASSSASSASSSSATAALPPRTGRLRIAWNHRHEYDKNPDEFFSALRWLHEQRGEGKGKGKGEGGDFEVVVLGEQFAESPPCFAEARAWLEKEGKVAHWGYAPDRAGYISLLRSCDVAVSTAVHEFFGIAMVEALALGVFPLAPCDLAYPEVLAPNEEDRARANETKEKIAALVHSCPVPGFFAQAAGEKQQAATQRDGGAYKPLPRKSDHLYSTPQQLRKQLQRFVRQPAIVRAWRANRGEPMASADSSGAEIGKLEEEEEKVKEEAHSKRARIEAEVAPERGLEEGLAAEAAGAPPRLAAVGSARASDSFTTAALAPLWRALLL